MEMEEQQQQQSHHLRQNSPIIPKPFLDHHDPSSKPKALLPISFANGTLKKHHYQRPPPPPEPNSPSSGVFRECLKNHAASLGGLALDGCGEFMPSPNSTPSVPTSLTCAACGCHRNFHRRAPSSHLHDYRDKPDEDEDEDDEPPPVADRGEEDADHSSSPPPYYSAPHMLMALSAGQGGGGGPVGASAPPAMLPRKRFRSKFSAEQKGRMLQLSERLGWRMQKRDEAVVEQCCREIGIGRGVFKVWMHNNKHNFYGNSLAKHSEMATEAALGGGGGGVCVGDGIRKDEGSGNGNANGSGHGSSNDGSSGHCRLNGSSPSSS